jgi:hypothetical protein
MLMREGLHEQISARKSFEDAAEKRVYKKRTIGSVVELPTRRDAGKGSCFVSYQHQLLGQRPPAGVRSHCLLLACPRFCTSAIISVAQR